MHFFLKGHSRGFVFYLCGLKLSRLRASKHTSLNCGLVVCFSGLSQFHGAFVQEMLQTIRWKSEIRIYIQRNTGNIQGTQVRFEFDCMGLSV